MIITQLIQMSSHAHPEMSEYLDVLESEAERYATHLDAMNLEDAVLKLCDESFWMNELFTEEERMYCGLFLIAQIHSEVIH